LLKKKTSITINKKKDLILEEEEIFECFKISY